MCARAQQNNFWLQNNSDIRFLDKNEPGERIAWKLTTSLISLIHVCGWDFRAGFDLSVIYILIVLIIFPVVVSWSSSIQFDGLWYDYELTCLHLGQAHKRLITPQEMPWAVIADRICCTLVVHMMVPSSLTMLATRSRANAPLQKSFSGYFFNSYFILYQTSSCCS